MKQLHVSIYLYNTNQDAVVKQVMFANTRDPHDWLDGTCSFLLDHYIIQKKVSY
jgi:hypothetical protein